MAVLIGCTSVPESSASTEVSDSAGVRIVHSHHPRWAGGSSWSVSREPRVSIGVLSGPEEYQFVQISAAARQSDGDIVVVDRGARAVRLYDSEGAFIRTLGEPGSGPGEFTDPVRVTVTGGDTLAVWDQALFRVTRFEPDGELVDVRGVDLATIGKAMAPPLYPGAVEPLADGSLLVRIIEKAGRTVPTGSSRPASGALRVSGDLSVMDTLMFFGDTEEVSVEAPWGAFTVSPPLARRTWIAHQGIPSRICIGDQEGPEIVCFEPDGTRTLVRWDSEPTPLTREEIEAWREENVRLFDLKLGPDQVQGMLDQVPIPEARPDYSWLTLDGSGNLWAEVGPGPGDPFPTVDFLVFDGAGALLGTVPLPPIRVLEVGDDYVLGVHQDELEVQYVQVYEIRKPGENRGPES